MRNCCSHRFSNGAGLIASLAKSHAAKLALAACFVTLMADKAPGQQWAEKMFSKQRHDFGTVVRGAEAEHRFELKNDYKKTVHIGDVRSSCGCTEASVTRHIMSPGETSAVVAMLDTKSFTGQNSATIKVVFDKPFSAEVQLRVSGYIRTDIRLDPLQADFGEVGPGDPREREVIVTHYGNSDWRLTDVRTQSPHLTVNLAQPEISHSRVRYQMTVEIVESMPTGRIREKLTLVSNDSERSTTGVSVIGRIRRVLSVSPAAVSLGRTGTGRSESRRVVVWADKPFAIREVDCDDDRFVFDIPEGRKKLHFLKLQFAPGKSAPRGDDATVSETIRVISDLPGNKSAKFHVTGIAQPSSPANDLHERDRPTKPAKTSNSGETKENP